MAHTLGTQEQTQSELTNIFLTPNRNQYIYAQLVSTINTKTGLQLLRTGARPKAPSCGKAVAGAVLVTRGAR